SLEIDIAFFDEPTLDHEDSLRATSEPEVYEASEPRVRAASEPRLRAASEPRLRAASEPRLRAASEPGAHAASEPEAASYVEPPAAPAALVLPASAPIPVLAPATVRAPVTVRHGPHSLWMIAAMLAATAGGALWFAEHHQAEMIGQLRGAAWTLGSVMLAIYILGWMAHGVRALARAKG